MKKKDQTEWIRRTGASLYGKFASVVSTRQGVEVYTSSALLLVSGLWVFAIAFFGISLFFGNLIVSMILTGVGGALGFYCSIRFFNGKLVSRFDFKDIASFMMEPPSFVINTKDGKMFELRMLPKKQALLMEDIKGMVSQSCDYKLEKNGQYYRIQPRQTQQPKDKK